MSFKDFADRVFQREGYRSNHPADKGGLTIWGITERDYPAEVAMMAKMGPEEAMEIAAGIYRKKYWDKVQGDALEHIAGGDLADQVADFAVNAGISRASMTLQRVLNLFAMSRGKWDPVNVDGVIGSETLAAVGRAILANPDRYRALLPKTYRALRMQFYIAIAQQDTSQRVFLEGWLLRA